LLLHPDFLLSLPEINDRSSRSQSLCARVTAAKHGRHHLL
jgi:hypothetical protein